MVLTRRTPIDEEGSALHVGAYVLAGGLSSRMGQDKAMLTLGGKTLLARAVESLRAVRVSGRTPRVTVVGERRLLEGADRVISDRHPGHGPLGGIEAALADLKQESAFGWALFLPVDMPFVTRSLLESLLGEWTVAAGEGALVCHVTVGETPQPLVSLVHTGLHPFLENALSEGRLKVTPVLHSACVALASADAGTIGSGKALLRETRFPGVRLKKSGKVAASHPTLPRIEDLWFTNVNNVEEFSRAETLFSIPGFLDSWMV